MQRPFTLNREGPSSKPPPSYARARCWALWRKNRPVSGPAIRSRKRSRLPLPLLQRTSSIGKKPSPAYQNPDRRGRAEVTRGDRDDQDGERFIKHTDIHLRIRTLIAEAGRELRTATRRSRMKRLADSTVSAFCTRFLGHPRGEGETRSCECSRQNN